MRGLMCVVVTMVLSSAAAAPAGAQASRSPALAAELSGLLAERKIDSVAAIDPEAPDRFVAALLFPTVQLLVVGAKYPVPTLMQQQIATRTYRDAYGSLQQAGATDGKVFFQDLGADGLGGAGAVDILYEDVVKQTVFDGGANGKMSKAEYQARLAAADATYSRLLGLLIKELKEPKTP